ncbi:hypothetical protein HNY73_011197 [Argiope bruennichi]|uniref:Uncharacterized protein n=1 Tax=Argiope bruennichi TaxID=94029 RepID=A0A8T0F3C7_ARGBR|nr:hypothetical protein HNY73_011197 [Argiope bruennichi]
MALKISTKSVEVMKRAGMVLRKWQTNSVPLRERYKQSGIETDDTKGNISGCGVPCKVLGLTWDPDKDLIFFDVNKLKDIAANDSSTKRFVLHVLGHIFDPIGFLGPFIMKLKILIQELWAAKIDWNSELLPLLDYKWQLWCSEIEPLNEIFISRHYLSGLTSCDFISFDINSFSDSPMKTYGCVVYLRGTKSLLASFVPRSTDVVCSKFWPL